jgi:hypothetical protein
MSTPVAPVIGRNLPGRRLGVLTRSALYRL